MVEVKKVAPARQTGATTKTWGYTNNCSEPGISDVAAALESAVSRNHKLAIAYASRGIAVGALNGKVPVKIPGVQEHGVLDFTTDKARLRAMWERYPAANIGGRPPVGCVVLDVDPRNGGADTWHQINAEQAELPCTFTTRTGSGGIHAWYRLPYALPVRGTAGNGIDLKTCKGYLVMPGSIHPDTGQYYTLKDWVWPPAVLPEQWCRHVYKPVRVPRRAVNMPIQRGNKTGLAFKLVQEMRATTVNRNNTLYVKARRAWEYGLDIENDLKHAALDTGLGLREVEHTLASARHAHMKGVA